MQQFCFGLSKPHTAIPLARDAVSLNLMILIIIGNNNNNNDSDDDDDIIGLLNHEIL